MSNDQNLDTIKLFRTAEHACSYLPERQSRTLFLDPELDYSVSLYEHLTQAGFRRSGKHLYRPDCGDCKACIPSRIPVDDFQLSRKFRRVMSKNKEISISLESSSFRTEDYHLFAQYINERHQDGDMYPASEESYRDFLAVQHEFSFQIHMRLNGELIAVAVTDHLISGLSAIYTFFSPKLDKNSLGVLAILSQIDLCKQWQLPYLYLGYWVPGCRKMEYKIQYQPVELLINGQWQLTELKG